jgi:outer membrane receptor for ferrienterochelin and colicins
LTRLLTFALCLFAAGSLFGQGDKALFGDLPAIDSVSLHSQTLAEAPANITVITAAEIRRYGYRTLADALASVRGFYVNYDHDYHYVGVSGISLPGDYNTRFLVMLNGHPLTDNLYNSNGFFGQDFGLDMDLVDRIEIIRGPTSALYGSNGILANINVVTHSPVDAERLRASIETDSAGERKLSLSASLNLGRGANLLIAGSAFNNLGLAFPTDGLTVPRGTPNPVNNSDGERGYHTFANLIWHNWSFLAYFNSRHKEVPVGYGSAFSGDPGQHTIDGRNFVGAVYKRSAGPGELLWQIFYDSYRYQDRYDYPGDNGAVTVRDYNFGDWIDSQLAYTLPVPAVGPLTLGVSGNWDLRARQYNIEDGALEDDTSRPDRGAAFFLQQEWKLSDQWKVDGGLRFDATRWYGNFLSPRLAVVWQSSPHTVYKAVYGRPFRNPSAFEQFYNDGGYSFTVAQPLRPEAANTFEVSMERQLARDWTLTTNASYYRINHVIEAVYLPDGTQQYQNTSLDRSMGLEFELSGKLWDRLETSASASFGNAGAGPPLVRLANSPAQISKLRMGAPVGGGELRDRLFVSGSLQWLSARNTWTGQRLGGALLADFTATFRLLPRFDLEAGIRNAFDRRYEDPIFLSVDRLRGDGRSAFVRLVWRVLD